VTTAGTVASAATASSSETAAMRTRRLALLQPRTSGLLQGVVTPLEPCIFLVRHPAVGKGPLTCEDMKGCEHVSVNPGLDVVSFLWGWSGRLRGHDESC
jgi:hypothetical protein